MLLFCEFLFPDIPIELSENWFLAEEMVDENFQITKTITSPLSFFTDFLTKPNIRNGKIKKCKSFCIFHQHLNHIFMVLFICKTFWMFCITDFLFQVFLKSFMLFHNRTKFFIECVPFCEIHLFCPAFFSIIDISCDFSFNHSNLAAFLQTPSLERNLLHLGQCLVPTVFPFSFAAVSERSASFVIVTVPFGNRNSVTSFLSEFFSNFLLLELRNSHFFSFYKKFLFMPKIGGETNSAKIKKLFCIFFGFNIKFFKMVFIKQFSRTLVILLFVYQKSKRTFWYISSFR